MNIHGEILSRVVNDSLNTSRSSEDKEIPPMKPVPVQSNGQPIRRSSFYLEHSAKMSKGSTPTQQSDNYNQGFYPQNLHPFLLRQTPSWESNRVMSQPYYPMTDPRIVKRLSFSTEPMTNLFAKQAPRKRWSECNIQPLQEPEKKWNCAVFVDMEESETSSSSDEEEEEKEDPQVKKRTKQERANSLRECIFQEFGDKRIIGSQDTLSTGTSKSDIGTLPSRTVKYETLPDLKTKEEILQKEHYTDSSSFLQSLILRRNNVLNEEFQLATDPRKAGDRRTSWDPSLLRRSNPWDGSEEFEQVLEKI